MPRALKILLSSRGPPTLLVQLADRRYTATRKALTSHGLLVLFALAMEAGYGANAAMTPWVAGAKFGMEGLGRLHG